MKRYVIREPVISAHQFNGTDDIKPITQTSMQRYTGIYTTSPHQLVVRSNFGPQYEYTLNQGDWFVKVEGELPVVMTDDEFRVKYTEEKC